MESHHDEPADRNVSKVPATLGMMIGGFLLIAAIAVILVWAL